MVPEKLADRLWCPFARTTWARHKQEPGQAPGWSTTQHPAFNRVLIERSSEPEKLISPCVGSRCMAWRWFSVPKPEAGDAEAEDAFEKEHGEFGYCGLAGRPE